jgi:hypothetical protein
MIIADEPNDLATTQHEVKPTQFLKGFCDEMI